LRYVTYTEFATHALGQILEYYKKKLMTYLVSKIYRRKDVANFLCKIIKVSPKIARLGK